jgi:hypothetical protein
MNFPNLCNAAFGALRLTRMDELSAEVMLMILRMLAMSAASGDLGQVELDVITSDDAFDDKLLFEDVRRNSFGVTS